MAYKIVKQSTLYFRSDETGYYKEVLCSLTRSLGKSGGVVYEVGKPTKPIKGNGPLAAFKTLEDVDLFVSEHGWRGYPVFRCRIRRKKCVTSLWVGHSDYYDISKLTFRKRELSELSLPPGTVLCKSITLTKQIR